MLVLIDGEAVSPAEAKLSVFDATVLRGIGCFEAMRVYGGSPFEVERHLDRLEKSARVLRIELPARATLRGWIEDVARERDDGVVRVLATPGGSVDDVKTPPRVVVLSQPLPRVPDTFRLKPQVAPWHPAGADWALTGVKSLSYGPNVAAQREAVAAGFDDALLLSRDDIVLEAPTSAVAWVIGGVLELPTLELGVLESVTRAVILEEATRLGIAHREGRYALGHLLGADEVMILATSKEVRAVTAIGEQGFEPGPVTEQLHRAFRARVSASS